MLRNAYGMNAEKEFFIERSTVMSTMKSDLKKERKSESAGSVSK